jgi:hypothetical protein
LTHPLHFTALTSDGERMKTGEACIEEKLLAFKMEDLMQPSIGDTLFFS